ncbi:uncharacterized protein DS421_4g131080 [Arachis hypogaea]|nr:uncharacterized protein DS421_4g131080 [Arachis hypogaea]
MLKIEKRKCLFHRLLFLSSGISAGNGVCAAWSHCFGDNGCWWCALRRKSSITCFTD